MSTTITRGWGWQAIYRFPIPPSVTGILIPIERIAFPIQQLEPVKDTAKSLLASAERDPKAIVARDQYER